MVNISKHSLSDHLKSELYEQLLDVLITKPKAGISKKAFANLLTETELIQLSKRLAIIIMLIKEVPEYRIFTLLKVSPSTVHTHALKLKRGDYEDIEIFVNAKKKNRDLWKILDVLLRAGLPRYAGKGRWQWLDDINSKI